MDILQVAGLINGKTPISYLHELAMKYGFVPIYELVRVEGVRRPVFTYKVFLNMKSDVAATGTGRSKKAAKHAAAKNLALILASEQSTEKIIANQTNALPEVSDISSVPVVTPFHDKKEDNPILLLEAMCKSRRWPSPLYTLKHEKTRPRGKFAIECQVLKIQKVGIRKTKMSAKRVAATKMQKILQALDRFIFKNQVPT